MHEDIFDHLWLTYQQQATLRYPIWCRGVGVHLGVDCEVHLAPALPNSGITFILNDGKHPATRIPAKWSNSRASAMRTLLVGDKDVEINTIEHLMAALLVSGIDNIDITVSSGELPILDGSATDWMFLLDCAGRQQQPNPQSAIVVTGHIRVENDLGWIEIEPNDVLNVGYIIKYDHPMIGDDSLSIDITRANFIKDISAARTFGFHQDAVRLQRLGLALGANLKNTVVFGSTSVMNSEGLRWPNEPVRHKILDMIGDLALAGAPIVAKVRGYCSGHSLNHALVSQLMATPTAWKWSHQ